MIKYIDINFVQPSKDCDICDYINEYVCFDCESEQVRNKYPDAKWDLPDWIIEK